jgi:hypothetical protein
MDFLGRNSNAGKLAEEHPQFRSDTRRCARYAEGGDQIAYPWQGLATS